MGKRSNFIRKDRDFYSTPEQAVLPLLKHLKPNTVFTEPCAGDYRLVNHLEKYGHKCDNAFDIYPMDKRVKNGNALNVFKSKLIITNPPWDRKVLHPMIDNFRNISPCWLLFDADWIHTKQSSDMIKYCSKIVSIGRVKWFGDTSGKDNACWYLFEQSKTKTKFIGR